MSSRPSVPQSVRFFAGCEDFPAGRSGSVRAQQGWCAARTLRRACASCAAPTPAPPGTPGKGPEDGRTLPVGASAASPKPRRPRLRGQNNPGPRARPEGRRGPGAAAEPPAEVVRPSAPSGSWGCGGGRSAAPASIAQPPQRSRSWGPGDHPIGLRAEPALGHPWWFQCISARVLRCRGRTMEANRLPWLAASRSPE